MAKRNYSGKLRNKFSTRYSASVWKGMQDIANYKTPSPSTLENQQMADDFNEFNDFNNLFIHHTYFFISNLHMSDLTHNCLYCILCFHYFVRCLFVYLYIVILLSVSCPVAVILLHCGASVTIKN